MATDVMEHTETGAIQRLAEAVDTLAAIEPDWLDTTGSLAVARAAEQVSRAAEAVLIRCVRTWHDRGDPVQSPETTQEELAWRAADAARKALMIDLGRSRGEAGRLIATAKTLRRDSPTAEALRSGRISAPQARIIADTLTILSQHPEAPVAAARVTMIDHARAGGTEDLPR